MSTTPVSENSTRQASLGQDYTLTLTDRFGIWLSARWVRACCGDITGKRLADIGCGYRAEMGRHLMASAAHVDLVDVSVAPDLHSKPNVTIQEGQLPAAINPVADHSVDIVICNSVIEHLWEPSQTLAECFRILKPGGVFLINVPSWRGKWFLEFSGFTLGLSTSEEINDHKIYYDPKELWPLLVRTGFKPRDITCRTHKFGLNTYAVCRKEGKQIIP